MTCGFSTGRRNKDKYIWIFDKPITPASNNFDNYADNIDAHIEVGMPYDGSIIDIGTTFKCLPLCRWCDTIFSCCCKEFWESIG